MKNINELNKQSQRKEFNRKLDLVKRLILNGFSDESFSIIQEQMLLIRDNCSLRDYTKLNEFVRNSFTDDVDVKELNELIRTMKLEINV